MNGNFNCLSYFRDLEADIHYKVVESFYSWVNKMGFNAKIIKETDLEQKDFDNIDLCISLGNFSNMHCLFQYRR